MLGKSAPGGMLIAFRPVCLEWESVMRTPQYRHGVTVLTLAVVASCTSSSEPSAVALDITSAISLGQGDTTTTEVTLTRSHFDKPVHLSVTGGATGVSASVLPATISGAQSTATLMVVASGSASPGTVQLTVHASGDGIAPQSATVDVAVSVTGSYTLSTADASVRVAQNGGNGTTIVVNRIGGHADSVHLTVTGAPAGMVATVQPSATVTSDSWLDVTASGSVAPGTYPLTIHGTANSLAEQTTTLNVHVIAPPATASLTIPFCSGQEPGWFAYQNDGYPWTAVTASNSQFTFNATSKVAIAFAFVASGFSQTVVYYATRHDLSAINTLDCEGAIAVSGKTQGLVTGQEALIGMAGATAASVSQYTLSALPSRALDLVGTTGLSVGGGSFVPDKMIIYRGLTPADGDTLPTLDFGGPDAFDLLTSTLTIAGTGSFDQTQQQTTLWSATSTHGAVQTNGDAPSSMTLYSVPPAHVAAGDVHELALFTGPSNTSGREVYSYYATTGDRTETFDPTLSPVTVTNFALHPYLRMGAQMASQPEYGSFVIFGFEQVTQTDDHLIYVAKATNFLAALPSVWNVTIPNFGTPAGFNPNWMLQPGQVTYYLAEALSGRPDLILGALPQDGDRISDAFVIATTQSLRGLSRLQQLRASRALPGARRLSRLQYFKR
jgi:hypothetical protein